MSMFEHFDQHHSTKNERRLARHGNMQLVFTDWWRSGENDEELKQKPKERWVFVDAKCVGSDIPSGQKVS